MNEVVCSHIKNANNLKLKCIAVGRLSNIFRFFFLHVANACENVIIIFFLFCFVLFQLFSGISYFSPKTFPLYGKNYFQINWNIFAKIKKYLNDRIILKVNAQTFLKSQIIIIIFLFRNCLGFINSMTNLLQFTIKLFLSSLFLIIKYCKLLKLVSASWKIL